MVYLGDPVSQLDGTKFAHQNCVAAVTSELGDCSSLGYWNVPPARIRSISGDTSGGLSYDDSVAALKEATNGEVSLKVLYWAPPSTLDDLLDAPRVAAISILCSVTRYTPFRTGTFTGRHNVAVGAKRYVTLENGTRQKQAYVMDPGRTDAVWRWWPWDLLIKAAKASTGANAIHCYYTRDLAGVSRPALQKGVVRSAPKIVNNPSNKVGTIVKGQDYPVVSTVRGGKWSVDNKVGYGWSKIGAGKYVVGGKLR